MKKINLQPSVVYGPLHSRRLGVSLGINLLPSLYKLCSFNCIYCQYGFTEKLVFDNIPADDFLKKSEIIQDIEIALTEIIKNRTEINFITFAGNGEPTLHPDFSDIVHEVIALRDAIIPCAKLAILSNSSTVTKPIIRDTLNLFDKKIMKLDAGDEETFRKINQAHSNINYDTLVDNLASFNNVTLQTLFLEGNISNSTDTNISSLITQYRKIKPELIQIYSLDREPADSLLKKVSPTRMREIQETISGNVPFTVEVF